MSETSQKLRNSEIQLPPNRFRIFSIPVFQFHTVSDRVSSHHQTMRNTLFTLLLLKITSICAKDLQLEFSYGDEQVVLKIKEDEDPLRKAIEFCVSNDEDSLNCYIKIGTHLADLKNQSLDFGSIQFRENHRDEDLEICDPKVHNRFDTIHWDPEARSRLNFIHTYSSKTNLPLELLQVNRWNKSILKNHSNFLFFDDQDIARFVSSVYPQFSDVFESFRFKIQKIDFFRYLAVYHFGGLYMDMDVVLRIPFGCDSIDTSKAVFPIEQRCDSDWTTCHDKTPLSGTVDIGDSKGRIHIGQYAFYAPKGHPFVGAIIDEIVHTQRASKDFQEKDHVIHVIETTGNSLVTKTYAALEDKSSVILVEPVPFRSFSFGEYGFHMAIGSWKI